MVTVMRVESIVKAAPVSKRKARTKKEGTYEKEGNSSAKLKSTIMIIGQRDSEAREVERDEEKKDGGIEKPRLLRKKKESRKGKLM